MLAPFVLGGIAAVGLACGGLLDEPENITFRVDAPLRITRGEDFQITITVENTASEAQTLYSLDVADAYLAGIAITGSTPSFTESSHVPIDNTWSYSYKIEIPAGESLSVVFDASALNSGDFSGDIDACINSEVNYLSWPVRTLVE